MDYNLPYSGLQSTSSSVAKRTDAIWMIFYVDGGLLFKSFSDLYGYGVGGVAGASNLKKSR